MSDGATKRLGGLVLEMLMKAADMTRPELAAATTVSDSTIGNYMRGDTSPSIEKLDDLLTAVEYTMEQYVIILTLVQRKPLDKLTMANRTFRLTIQDEDTGERIRRAGRRVVIQIESEWDEEEDAQHDRG